MGIIINISCKDTYSDWFQFHKRKIKTNKKKKVVDEFKKKTLIEAPLLNFNFFFFI